MFIELLAPSNAAIPALACRANVRSTLSPSVNESKDDRITDDVSCAFEPLMYPIAAISAHVAELPLMVYCIATEIRGLGDDIKTEAETLYMPVAETSIPSEATV